MKMVVAAHQSLCRSFVNLAQVIASFTRDTRAGATAIAAAAFGVMMLGGAALIIDHVQLIGRRDLLKSASDAASISATLELNRLPDSLSDAELQLRLMPIAKKYAVLNVIENVNDPNLTPEAIQVTLDIDRTARAVSATVRADIGHTLLSEGLFSYSGPGTISTKSGAESQMNPIEVVLAIDISGSMARDLDGTWTRNSPDSRMAIVKRAARNLVSILEPSTERRVAIGIVPWHFTVRVPDPGAWVSRRWAEYPGSRHYSSTFDCRPEPSCISASETAAFPPQPETWRGCVDEQRILSAGRADHVAVANSLNLPAAGSFAMAFYPASYGIGYQCLSRPLPSGYQRQVCYHGDDSATGQRRRPPQFGCDDTQPFILPLSSDRIALGEAIDSLEPIGWKTHSALGVLWAQRLLQHGWRDVWGTTTAEHDGQSRKAIVLLTDGQDTQCREEGDPACQRGGGVPRTEACTIAKDRGTEIFVIAAMEPRLIETAFGQTLRDCASSEDHVFLNNATPEALERAFADIASQLIPVRRIY